MKLDSYNKQIIKIIHANADISNQKLAGKIGLSSSACFQRTKALKEGGYFVGFHSDLDLDRMVEHVLAYVEFKLESNSPPARKVFLKEISRLPQFMDCFRVTGDFDFISLTCCTNTQSLTQLCDQISGDPKLGVQRIKTRIIMERAKWYLGYPLDELKWIE